MDLAEGALNSLKADLRPANWSADSWHGAGTKRAENLLNLDGLPQRIDEYWKYSDPRDFIDPADQAAESSVCTDALIANSHQIYSEQGSIKLLNQTVQSLLQASECDLHVTSLRQADSANSDRNLPNGELLTDAWQFYPRGLAAAAFAMAGDGLLIECKGKPALPLELRHNPGRDYPKAMFRHSIRVASGGHLQLIESGIAAPWSNSVIEIELEDDASCQYIRIFGNAPRAKASNSVFVNVGERSRFNMFTLTGQSRWTRSECVVTLSGDESEASLSGAALGMGSFHNDDTVLVVHKGQNCRSRQVFKKVLLEKAKGVFQGKILVRPNAQKTDGYQISQGLLLNQSAEFLVKPELEIYADDVACSHGSTSGGADEKSMFYLRSRGIKRSEAQQMLALAFLADAINEVSNSELRAPLHSLASRWFPRVELDVGH